MLDSDQLHLAEKQLEPTDFMRVVVNSETFLMPVKAVLGVLRPVKLTPVPMAPDHLIGVANVRGQIFCIVDLGKVLHLSGKRKSKTKDSRMLLLRHARVHLGVWVEEVFDLLRINAVDLPEDSGHQFKLCEVETEHGVLPILRVEALFD